MNEDAALLDLRRRAHDGAPQALYQLASALVARHELDEAFTLHRRAAEAGLANAQIEYARMLMYGVGCDAEPVRAAEWLLRAESAGSPIASYFLALMSLGGRTLPRDGRINERVLRAVRADYPPALRAAAVHFGRKADPADQLRCLQLLERGAGLGDVVAARLLVERMRRGEGDTPQPEAAADLRAQLQAIGIGPLPEIVVPDYAPNASAPGVLSMEDVLQPVALTAQSARPNVATVDGLLSAEECRLLIANAQTHLQRSRTVDPETGLPFEQEIRTSSDAAFDAILEDLALRCVQLRMASAAGLPLDHAEHLVVLRYEPGQEYRPHRDYRPPSSIERDRPDAGNRLRTICVYLNTVEAGGQTEFPVAGLKVEPRPGRAVVFENLHADGTPDPDSLHAGLPVERGEKWLATLWLRQAPYRRF
ncbi:2OG-Fe(II) oxygenase [Lysobacter auxotrophicus]|uniref:2OG-Fe(II) oxygenase n=1 Tax=Lysobacter auxotrophicus TaxID=2992573 RepID=A0ABM8DEQ8_9GAMM|nr:2OG-Fe(II) oxygenase [Lysobacter auxotrophicus]BDU17098.1 2OG-Fe(II) oxygenase [Lysobacter auxotrophicus]